MTDKKSQLHRVTIDIDGHEENDATTTTYVFHANLSDHFDFKSIPDKSEMLRAMNAGAENGNIRRISQESKDSDGKLHGQSKIFYEDGSGKEILTSEHGKLIRKVDLYQNGQFKHVENYGDNEELNGTVSTFYEDGKIKREAEYEHGTQEGTEYEYGEDGTITSVRLYEGGKVLAEFNGANAQDELDKYMFFEQSRDGVTIEPIEP